MGQSGRRVRKGVALSSALPSLWDLALPGQPFKCPICLTMQRFPNDRSWRSHAFDDLKAYRCTNPDTGCRERLFGQPDAWFKHELKEHRALSHCLLCGLGPLSRPALHQHLSTSHHEFNSDGFMMLEEGGRNVTKTLSAGDCPFCSSWEGQVRRAGTTPILVNVTVMVDVEQFKNHVAAHQEELAVLALLGLPSRTKLSIWVSQEDPSPQLLPT
ncbi:hypothetical protein C8A05DRAFT_20121 [Staphylotrichum tortipilum]|uniref:Oxidoreductase acuF-like C2H2 type zinc-finger domain-containing protein n=1 Tax=Staphylotrichum tortipilum TaxID=2831512 RepID=A0AAN6RNX3_9PEZI|nr:hypothetical protein C8A05DRAFT_20121 [Staphylotrichum longicolle]